MKEIRIHARAGQGAITTAYILGQAYFIKGVYAYAFPHFGAARMGAPMNAFVRADDKPVRIRSQIYEPDFIIIVDSTLMRTSDCLAGFKDDGVAIISEREDIQIPKAKLKQKIYIVPANKQVSVIWAGKEQMILTDEDMVMLYKGTYLRLEKEANTKIL